MVGVIRKTPEDRTSEEIGQFADWFTRLHPACRDELFVRLAAILGPAPTPSYFFGELPLVTVEQIADWCQMPAEPFHSAVIKFRKEAPDAFGVFDPPRSELTPVS
jgi:hypothetical protein